MTDENRKISTMMNKLSAYIAGAGKRKLSNAVIEKTKHHLLDTLAAMVSGSRLDPGKYAIKFARAQGGKAEACVIGSKLVTSAINAALANGMHAHADETDDSHQRGRYHPGCGTIAAALAVAERQRSSGLELIKAIALGYDIGVRFNLSLGPSHLNDEEHSTHSVGSIFGAAAAVALLMKFNQTQVRHLLSYTVQQASGVPCWTRDLDHIEKAFDFAGMPARDAVTAAVMIELGFTGVEDALSGNKNFFKVFTDTPKLAEVTKGLGKRYEILDAQIKKWSVGMPNQSVLDALEILIREHDFKANDVDKVSIRIPNKRFHVSDNSLMPDICTQHLASIMLLDGTVTFKSSHDEKRMKDKKVLAMRKRVQLIPDDALVNAKPLRQGIVEIRLKDGRKIRHHTKAVHGTPQNPMSREEVEKKALDLMTGILGKTKADKLAGTVWGMDQVPNVRTLRRLLNS
ncbi:MAG: MmgE/PrpD family protein [Rhodospirillaceae bacterium]|jgi:2-methylcitrate dehydratase PrpD